MKVLFAPWRADYIKGVKKPQNQKNTCVFCCTLEEHKDKENFVLGRYKNCQIILNLYPYASGHLMIIPNRHIANLEDLNTEELNELMYLTKESSRILKNKLNAEGINIGMNLGKASGAGIPEHLHMHALPRWQGDTGFLCSVGGTKVVSVDLNYIYNELKPEFDKV